MRLLLLQRFVAAAMTFIWGGLFVHQVVYGPDFRSQAERNRTRLIHLMAPRGSILDRHGVPLVEDRMSFELAVFPQELKTPQELFTRLSPIVGVPPEKLARVYRRGYQGPFAPVSLVQGLSPETAFLLEENRWGFPGILVRAVPRRRYFLGSALGPVTGYVGLITQEELTQMKPYGYTFRDFVGKDGLEQVYDRYLRGTDGGLQVEVDARGKFVRQMGFRNPERGRQVTVSLDGRLQEFCYRKLEGRAGAILVMDASTGQILALASAPTFDPNAFLDSDRALEIRQYLHSHGQHMFNRATRSAVPPGSTFKVAVAYAALHNQKISPETTFDCTGSFQLGKRIFQCWWKEGHGPQTVTDALQHSCNVFFYNTGRRLGVEGLIQTCRLFGLGQLTGIDLPHEAKGFVPDPAWMHTAFQQSWQEGDTISFGIGQGALQTTPLQMLLLTTAVAMDGMVPKPHLLLGIEGEKPTLPPKGHRVSLDKAALMLVRKGMEQVVSSPTGTGRLAQLPTIHAAGKTGTAQVSRGLPHAWFCGYAPAEKPSLSFVIFLEHGGKGGEQAALVVRDLLVYLHELEYL